MTQQFALNLKPNTLLTFQPTLDGALYNATCPWGLFGQRAYLTIATLQNARILTTPLVGTPDPIALASCVWNELAAVVVVTTQTPHSLMVGSIVKMTISGVTPSIYNGTRQYLVASPTTLTYPQTSDPGPPATAQGVVCKLVNLVGGYFASTLILRESTKIIEVDP